MRVRLIPTLVALATLTVAGAASAHFELTSPKPSSTTVNGGKGGFPCGPDASSATVTSVMGGSMLPIMIKETVFHPGHYRVVLVTSRADIPMDPVVRDSGGQVLNPAGPGNSESAEIMAPPTFPVIADSLFPHTADMSPFSGAVALPNINCDPCTLQVIEFMSKHGPDYFYRHCADLKLTADPNKPLFDPNGTGGTGGSGGTGGTGGSGSSGSSGGPSSGGMSNGGLTSGGMPMGGAGTVLPEGSQCVEGSSKAQLPDGDFVDCAPYICEATSNNCLQMCVTSLDCAPGFVCNNVNDNCESSNNANHEDGGCGCRTVADPGAQRSALTAAWLVGLSLVLISRRARRSQARIDARA